MSVFNWKKANVCYYNFTLLFDTVQIVYILSKIVFIQIDLTYYKPI